MTKNILLVEYDDSTIHVIKELFQAPVFDVAVASDGEAAKQLLNQRDFDLMITAAMLPRFHGFNLALAVSQDHPGMKTIIISAIYKGSEYKHQAVTQYRASDFFEKPLDKEKFKKRVLELLNVAGVRPERRRPGRRPPGCPCSTPSRSPRRGSTTARKTS